MILYNVTISIDKQVESEWLRWMKTVHIPDVMATGCFESHRMLRIMFEENQDSSSYAIQYVAADMQQFQKYQTLFATRLQEEHGNRYKGKYAAFRSLLEEV
jgi:hypothetical protein